MMDKKEFIKKCDEYCNVEYDYASAVALMKEAYLLYPDDVEVLYEYIKVLMANNIDDEVLGSIFERIDVGFSNEQLLEQKMIYLYRTGEELACKKFCEEIINGDYSRIFVAKAMKTWERISGQRYVRHAAEDESKALEDLMALIGLDSVKKQIEDIKKAVEYNRFRNENLNILADDGFSYNYIFYGNPGTGKTTVARLMGEIFKSIGVLEKGHLVEVSRATIVSQYIGETAINMKKAIDDAIGGVLFIDEAYSLNQGGEKDFGHEAIDTLVSGIENNRGRLVVILAGYKNEMEKLIKSNPGLGSRFSKFIDFPDYTEDELFAIAKAMAKEKKYTFTKDGEIAFREKISRLMLDESYGNARAVRNVLEEAFMSKARNFDYRKADNLYLTTLTADDFNIEIDHDDKTGIEDLYSLIGLKNVKSDINSLISIAKYKEEEKQSNGIVTTDLPININMVFSGNPGTGKTTVARIYGKILKEYGILKKGHLIEASRQDLVGRWQGHTASITSEICKKAYGGILFIDEAYSLVLDENDTFGLEAIDVIIKEMEDNRDKLAVIFAGYTEEMQVFVNANPGLKSRIGKEIVFPDYSEQELLEIFISFLRQRNVSIVSDAEEVVKKEISDLYLKRDKKFGNAREMRKLAERIWQKMVNRVVKNGIRGKERSIIIKEDV